MRQHRWRTVFMTGCLVAAVHCQKATLTQDLSDARKRANFLDAPKNVRVTLDAQANVVLTWSLVGEADGYYIYYAPEPGVSAQSNRFPGSDTTRFVHTPGGSGAIHYRVSAFKDISDNATASTSPSSLSLRRIESGLSREVSSFIQIPVCGNSIVESGEECDTSGNSVTCDFDCTLAACNDGVFNPLAEPCDSGGVDTAACNRDCTEALCGDGYLNQVSGETCDDAGDSPLCDSDCSAAVCGDGYHNLKAAEECDSGGILAATCDLDCTRSVCGDGVLNPVAGELCDSSGVDTTACDGGDCTFPQCGDQYLNHSLEQCDAGAIDTAGCNSATCTNAQCGDGYVNLAAGEACDDGGDSLLCDSDCTEAFCGDHYRNPLLEECDEGGDSPTCDSDCTMALCADGYINPAAGESCESGGVDTAACNGGTCTASVCGDGYLNTAAGETCDDGGVVPLDGCSALCHIESGVQAQSLLSVCGYALSDYQGALCNGACLGNARDDAHNYCMVEGFAGVAHMTEYANGSYNCPSHDPAITSLDYPTGCSSISPQTVTASAFCRVAKDVYCLTSPLPLLPTGAYLQFEVDDLLFAHNTTITLWEDHTPSLIQAISVGSNAPHLVKPALNTYPVIRFDGVDDFMALQGGPVLDHNVGYSVILVARVQGTTGDQTFFSAHLPADALYLGVRNGAFTYLADSRILSSVSADSLWHIHEVTVEGLSASAYMDGITLHTPVTLGGGALSTMAFGARGGLLDMPLQGEIAEVVIYDRPLTQAQRLEVLHYFRAKYGLP